MYIQITTRCNMKCPHCCFSCTNEGDDMSPDIFDKALELAGEYPCIGGGEPTIHPHFYSFMGKAIATAEYVTIITNGKMKERALFLAHLARKQVIGAEVSIDQYHEPIDKEVVTAFEEIGESSWKARGYFPGVRNTTKTRPPTSQGRGVTIEGAESGYCMCDNPIIKPNGDIVWCGCDNAPVIGHVNDGDYDHQDNSCYNGYGW